MLETIAAPGADALLILDHKGRRCAADAVQQAAAKADKHNDDKEAADIFSSEESLTTFSCLSFSNYAFILRKDPYDTIIVHVDLNPDILTSQRSHCATTVHIQNNLFAA